MTKEIAKYGRLRELLAQTIKSNSTEKQLRKEKQRFIPYHLQIDCDLVDFTHMACAMLLEIPNISKNDNYIKQNVISRPFRKLIDSADGALFNGPPENPREHIIYASRSLFHGEWKKALEFLFGANKVWRLIPESEEVQQVLTKKVKEVAFKVLMFRNAKFYHSFSIADLGGLFEVSEGEIVNFVSKLIVREKFAICINKEENVVQIGKSGAQGDQEYNKNFNRDSQMSGYQTIANVLVEKVKAIIDHNHQIVNHLTKIEATNALTRDHGKGTAIANGDTAT
jgi:translation initiation factor 3 subunit C